MLTFDTPQMFSPLDTVFNVPIDTRVVTVIILMKIKQAPEQETKLLVFTFL